MGHNKVQALYRRSPVWCQNLMVSMYGLQRHYRRHGGSWKANVDRLMASQWWSAEEFKVYQSKRFGHLLAHARKHVPYYYRLFRELGIESHAVVDTKGILELPFLEKDTIRLHLDDMVAEIYPRRRLYETHTSGSTGTPLTYFMYRPDIHERMAFLERQRRWAGVREGERCATFTGRILLRENIDDKAFWRHNVVGNQLVFSTYHMSPVNLPFYADKVKKFQPQIIEGYPSSIYILARWLSANRSCGYVVPKAVLTTAETLHDYQRSVIEEVFCAPVYDYYASSEAAPFITQCEAASLHVNPESGFFEFIRSDGSAAGPGETGEMIVTSFATQAMPLIRYRIRDLAVVGTDETCKCGRQMPRVEKIIGRMDDILFTKERGYIGRVARPLKVFTGSIIEAQIIQEDLDNLLIKLVRDTKVFDERHVSKFLEDVRSRVGSDIKIHLEYVDQIPRGPNNKFRFVVSKLTQADIDTAIAG